jgi:hypothetical protein
MNTYFPGYLSAIFVLTTLLAVYIFRWVLSGSPGHEKRKTGIIIGGFIIWLCFQGFLSLNNIYNSRLSELPPRLLLLGILPPMLLIVFLFASSSGRKFIDGLVLKRLIYLNIVRIPVEIGLLLLFLNKSVPKLMTLEGGNLDILSGLSAPVVAYYTFRKQRLSRKFLLAWNICCLALLANIVIRALLSAPFPFQKIGFEQPNIAVLNFPVVWLPTFIVPLVLFGQLSSIRQLLRIDALRK